MHYSEKTPPASAAQIDTTAGHLALPTDAWIRTFWAFSDGAMLADLVKIHATHERLERQQTYEIAEYFPDHVLVGDDSGGRLILLERTTSPRFYLLDAGCPSIDDAEVYSSLEELVAAVVAGD